MTSNTSQPNPDQTPPAHGDTQLPMVAVPHGPPALTAPIPANPWAGPSADEGINIVDYLHSLRRRWLLGLAVGLLLGALTAAILWMVVPETYVAASLLRVRRSTEQVMRDRGQRQTIDAQAYEVFKATQIALIKSFHVLSPALDDEARIGQLPMLRDVKDKVGYLSSALQVSYPDNAEVLRIALRGENPENCAIIVNAVTQSYLQNVVYEYNNEQSRRLQQLRDQLQLNQTEIRTKTNSLYELQKRIGTPDLAETKRRIENLDAEIAQIRRASLQLEQDKTRLGTSIARLQSHLRFPYQPGTTEIEMTMQENPSYQEAQARADGTEAALQQALAGSQRTSPVVARAQAAYSQAEQARQRLYEELLPSVIDQIRLVRGYDPNFLQAQVNDLQHQYQAVDTQLRIYEEAIAERQEEIQQYQNFSTDVEVLKSELAQLNAMTTNIKSEIDVMELNRQQLSQIQLLQDARAEEQSDITFKYFVVFGAALIVLVLSVVGFTLGDYLGKRVNSPSDVSKNTLLPVVGTLPLVHGGMLSHLWPFGKDSLPLKLQESIDSIRTAILYNKRPDPVRVVMVTSATSQEGKTTVASQLAVSLARAGRRTLLIDGDFQNPQQHEVFGMQNNTGFCDVLRGEVTAASVAIPTEAEGLWLMNAGYCDRKALQSLASPAARDVIEQLKSQFDYIILDSAPVLTGAEALLLGQLADSALLSIRRDVSRTPKVAAACQRLESVGVDLLGGILNGAPGEVRRYAGPTMEYEEEEEEYAEAEYEDTVEVETT